MSIRWREKDVQLLKKKVRNYNNKITRLKKKGYTENLPEKLSFKELHEDIQERRYFKSQVAIIDAFTKRGSEEVVKSNRGLVLPKFKIEEIKIMNKEINKDRMALKKRLNEMPITDRNKKLPKATREQVKTNIEEIKKKKFKMEWMSKKDFEMYEKTLKEYRESQSKRNAQYRQNYYFSILSNYTKEQSRELITMLQNLSDQDLVDKYYTDINMDIKYNYDPSDNAKRFDALKGAWGSYAREHKIKLDLQNDESFEYVYDTWLSYQKS